MKIAYICQSYPPMISGAAIVSQRLAKAISARGHQVLVIAASETGYGYASAERFLQVVRLPSRPNPVRVGQRFFIWQGGEIQKHLSQFQPNLIHLHDPLVPGVVGLATARDLGIPAILTIHQLPGFAASYTPLNPFLRRGIENVLWSYSKWLLNQCHLTIVPSLTTARLVARRTDNQPIVISNGVNTDRFSPVPTHGDEEKTLRSKYCLDPDLPVILHVGRLDADKQVQLMVEAAARAMQSVDAQLLVIGDGQKRVCLEGLCAAFGIADRSYFPGFITADGDLPGLYRLASVFITASEIETQGLVVLEALSSGLPVVAPQAGALPELVKEGINGYLTPRGDTTRMGERLAVLLRDTAKAKHFGLSGTSTAKAHSQRRFVDAHETIYSRALGRSITQKSNGQIQQEKTLS